MAETHGYPSVYCPSASRLSAFLITSVKRSPEVGRELLGVMVNASLFSKKSPSPPTPARKEKKKKGEEKISRARDVRRAPASKKTKKKDANVPHGKNFRCSAF